MVFSTFTGLCSVPSPQPILGHFSSSQKGTPFLSAIPSIPLCAPQPPATTELLSVSVDLPVLDVSCKWNHSPRGLLGGGSYFLNQNKPRYVNMSQYLMGETRWLKDQRLNRSVPLSVLLHLSDPEAPDQRGGGGGCSFAGQG